MKNAADVEVGSVLQNDLDTTLNQSARGAISMENNDTVTKRQLGSENNSAQANRPTYRFDRPAIEHRLLPTSSWGAYFRIYAIVAQIVRYVPVSWIMAFVDTGSLEIRNRRRLN